MENEYPDDLQYLESHEYVRMEGEIATIGISAYAVDQLGDIVHLELPEIGDAVKVRESFGTIESVKVSEELFPPVSGTVIERNETLLESPETIAQDPYNEGWLIKLRVNSFDETDLDDTLNASEYRIQVEGE